MLVNLKGFAKGYKIILTETDSLGLTQNSMGGGTLKTQLF